MDKQINKVRDNLLDINLKMHKKYQSIDRSTNSFHMDSSRKSKSNKKTYRSTSKKLKNMNLNKGSRDLENTIRKRIM